MYCSALFRLSPDDKAIAPLALIALCSKCSACSLLIYGSASPNARAPRSLIPFQSNHRRSSALLFWSASAIVRAPRAVMPFHDRSSSCSSGSEDWRTAASLRMASSPRMLCRSLRVAREGGSPASRIAAPAVRRLHELTLSELSFGIDLRASASALAPDGPSTTPSTLSSCTTFASASLLSCSRERDAFVRSRVSHACTLDKSEVLHWMAPVARA
mmetsp:Transcript_57837/g.125551  ORF Transcript_57837/g.125551 Transcript_57837/m.125551 type:complete len:215 (-) Transcript_57837:119-763(-)